MGVHLDGSDLLLLHGAVAGADSGGGNGIYHIHALGHLAEGGILTVQMLGILMHDEELGSGGIGGLAACHGQNAPLVPQVVLDPVEEELTLDAVAGATHAGAVRTASLDHKAGDDTVEDQPVVKAVVCKIDKVVNALGCDLRDTARRKSRRHFPW